MKTEMIEGPEARERLSKFVEAILKVPHSEIQKRITEHRKQAEKNPRKRGPKGKRTTNAFHGPDASA